MLSPTLMYKPFDWTCCNTSHHSAVNGTFDMYNRQSTGTINNSHNNCIYWGGLVNWPWYHVFLLQCVVGHLKTTESLWLTVVTAGTFPVVFLKSLPWKLQHLVLTVLTDSRVLNFSPITMLNAINHNGLLCSGSKWSLQPSCLNFSSAVIAHGGSWSHDSIRIITGTVLGHAAARSTSLIHCVP